MSTIKDLKKSKAPPAIGPANADGMVIVEIGPEKERYHIHKALLTHHSEYFSRALNGPWTEANTGVVTFVNVNTPECSQPVRTLALHPYLPSCRFGDDLKAWDHIVDQEQTFGSTSPPVLTLIKAYTLGDRLLAEGFRHATNEHLAFANIPDDKPILQFLVNDFCDNWQPDIDGIYDVDALANLPGKFVARALRCFALMRSRTTKANVDVCYIEHATATGEESCPKKHCSYDEEYDYSYS